MRFGLHPLLTVLLLAGCGADSGNTRAEAGPASCASINQACEGVDPGNNASDPVFQCQIAADGDDERTCATLDQQLNCLDRCYAAR